MEQNELGSEQITKDAKAPQMMQKVTSGVVFFLYALLELVFLIKVISLLTRSANLSGVDNLLCISSGLAFQISLATSALSLRRCVKNLSIEEHAALNRKALVTQFNGTVMFLLLAIMMFSNFTTAYDKLKP